MLKFEDVFVLEERIGDDVCSAVFVLQEISLMIDFSSFWELQVGEIL